VLNLSLTIEHSTLCPSNFGFLFVGRRFRGSDEALRFFEALCFVMVILICFRNFFFQKEKKVGKRNGNYGICIEERIQSTKYLSIR